MTHEIGDPRARVRRSNRMNLPALKLAHVVVDGNCFIRGLAKDASSHRYQLSQVYKSMQLENLNFRKLRGFGHRTCLL